MTSYQSQFPKSVYIWHVWKCTFHPYLAASEHHLFDSIWSISPFLLYIDTSFFAYDGMCLSALHQKMSERIMKQSPCLSYFAICFLSGIPFFSPSAIDMKVVSDRVVVQRITSEFKTFRTDLLQKIEVRMRNLLHKLKLFRYGTIFTRFKMKAIMSPTSFGAGWDGPLPRRKWAVNLWALNYKKNAIAYLI